MLHTKDEMKRNRRWWWRRGGGVGLMTHQRWERKSRMMRRGVRWRPSLKLTVAESRILDKSKKKPGLGFDMFLGTDGQTSF